LWLPQDAQQELQDVLGGPADKRDDIKTPNAHASGQTRSEARFAAPDHFYEGADTEVGALYLLTSVLRLILCL